MDRILSEALPDALSLFLPITRDAYRSLCTLECVPKLGTSAVFPRNASRFHRVKGTHALSVLTPYTHATTVTKWINPVLLCSLRIATRKKQGDVPWEYRELRHLLVGTSWGLNRGSYVIRIFNHEIILEMSVLLTYPSYPCRPFSATDVKRNTVRVNMLICTLY